MGNCICHHSHREPRMWVCCAQLTEKLNDRNLRSLVFYEERFVEDGEPRLDIGLAATTVDRLIDADLFAFEGIPHPVRDADSVLEAHKHLVKRGPECLLNGRRSLNCGDNLPSKRLKVSVSNIHLSVYAVTWNMNGKKSALQDLVKLAAWEEKEPYDLFVVGLQEVPSCDAQSIIIGAMGDSYSLVAAVTMMSLQLFVVGKKSLEAHFRDIRIDKVGSGGFGVVVRRQKGAVAVSFKYKGASFVFIASHFPPHKSNVEERNLQFQNICQSLFSRTASPWLSSCLTVSFDDDMVGYHAETLKDSVLDNSDLVVWLGDLNYRIQDQRSLVDALINQNLYKSLWLKDQLSREIQRGHAFKGFQEGPLSFRPTYKYDIGTDNYDTSPKERVPSWTDRILYKVKEGRSWIRVDVCDYDAIEAIKSSDHRPVKAVFTFDALVNRKFQRPSEHDSFH